jgi:hypothetical protein
MTPADRPSSARQVHQEVAVLRHEPATAGPSGTAPRAAALGLAGRPGQRRAVRATAVALGLLALTLGLRDAVDDDPGAPADGQQPRPVMSAPVGQGATQDEGEPPAGQDQQREHGDRGGGGGG